MSKTLGRSFPNAILHVDGDAFFAACEASVDPTLKGKPVVVGKERGIATALSYEAKQLGVTRGMPIGMVKQICPSVIILPGNYELYQKLSQRLFTVMREYTDLVEPYSIDEGFADITGFHTARNITYPEMAALVKKDVEKVLGLTVSVGLAPTKVLAKIASRCNKPDGLTVISLNQKDQYLANTQVESIWGVGRNTAMYMRSLGIRTAREFTAKSEKFVYANFTKPHQELWHELQGEKIYAVSAEEKTTYGSISKTHTFNPTTDRKAIFSEVVRNLEGACEKARKYKLGAQRVSVFLKRQTFTMDALDATCARASAYPIDLVNVIKPMFDRLFVPGTVYRATGISLGTLQESAHAQQSLFEAPNYISKMERIYQVVDTLGATFGSGTVRLGSTLQKSTVSAKPSLAIQDSMALPFWRGTVA
jgi:DNA polymerase-4/DNA polymerase V